MRVPDHEKDHPNFSEWGIARVGEQPNDEEQYCQVLRFFGSVVCMYDKFLRECT